MKKCVKVMSLFMVMLALLASAQFAYAAPTDEIGISKSVDMISVQGDFGYFSLKEGFQTPQMNNVCYVDLSSASGRLTFAMLLAMKASDLKLTRLVYDTAADGTCHVQLLQTQ